MKLRKGIRDLLGDYLDDIANVFEQAQKIIRMNKPDEKGNYRTVLERVRYHDRATETVLYLNDIHKRAPKTLQNFIDYKYIEDHTWQEAADKFSLDIRKAMKVRKLILEGLARRLGLDVSGPEERSRYVPRLVRDEVFKRDKGQCVKCDSLDKIHIHHKLKFSEGGEHIADNLMLLCNSCHAEEHAEERVYQLLKAMA